MTCNKPRPPFVGSGRKREGGASATRKQDFNAHISGTAYNHCADQLEYDNTTSGLTATNVQDAIDEVSNPSIPSSDQISYDNSTSGLSATNVQDAIDEVVTTTVPAGRVFLNSNQTLSSGSPLVLSQDFVRGGLIVSSGGFQVKKDGLYSVSLFLTFTENEPVDPAFLQISVHKNGSSIRTYNAVRYSGTTSDLAVLSVTLLTECVVDDLIQIYSFGGFDQTFNIFNTNEMHISFVGN